jgi:hypothetical protein
MEGEFIEKSGWCTCIDFSTYNYHRNMVLIKGYNKNSKIHLAINDEKKTYDFIFKKKQT